MPIFQNPLITHISTLVKNQIDKIILLNKNNLYIFRCKSEYPEQLSAVKQMQYQWRESITFFIVFIVKIIE